MIERKLIPSVSRCDLSFRKVGEEFDRVFQEGGKWNISGSAKSNPDRLLEKRFRPFQKIELFGTSFYFSRVQQIPELRYFVAFVVQRNRLGNVYVCPRIFYKDLSLVWRTASHFSLIDDELWIGKGDTIEFDDQGETFVASNESTTDLPIEMQTAVESLLESNLQRPVGSVETIQLVLRMSTSERIEPYADFTRPRKRAQSDPRNLVNGGKPIASFAIPNDPTSLIVIDGYQPDFSEGVIETSQSQSQLYGGRLRRFRILSVNRLIQYYFFSGKRHVWIVPPQSTTVELSSFGVRTVDVLADDDLFIPGYEYHHYEQTPDGPILYSQIPAGFVGEVCPIDDAKADASKWLNKIPMIQQFRRDVLKQKRI